MLLNELEILFQKLLVSRVFDTGFEILLVVFNTDWGILFESLILQIRPILLIGSFYKLGRLQE